LYCIVEVEVEALWVWQRRETVECVFCYFHPNRWIVTYPRVIYPFSELENWRIDRLEQICTPLRKHNFKFETLQTPVQPNTVSAHSLSLFFILLKSQLITNRKWLFVRIEKSIARNFPTCSRFLCILIISSL
jgi:hypothetical protein